MVNTSTPLFRTIYSVENLFEYIFMGVFGKYYFMKYPNFIVIFRNITIAPMLTFIYFATVDKVYFICRGFSDYSLHAEVLLTNTNQLLV